MDEIKWMRKRENIFFLKKRREKFNKLLLLALSYSAYPYIAVHCSKIGKKYNHTFTAIALFLYIMVLKIAI